MDRLIDILVTKVANASLHRYITCYVPITISHRQTRYNLFLYTTGTSTHKISCICAGY